MPHLEMRHDDRNDRRRGLSYAVAFQVGEKLRDPPDPENPFAEVFHAIFLEELMKASAKVGAFAFEPRCKEE